MTGCAMTRCMDYESSSIRKALQEIIANTDFPCVEGKTVLLKPNVLSDNPPEKAITTHPAVVYEIGMLIKEKGAARIIIGDSPGMQTGPFRPKLSGIIDVADKLGAELADFRDNPRMHERDGFRMPMAAVLDEADIVISIAKFKTHQLMYATGAVKNMFGLIPGLNKSPMHLKARTPESFARFLMAVFAESHTDYAFIDAVEGMEGPGPANGIRKHIGLLMGSANAYALDKAEAAIMGYSSVPLISEAERIQPGITDCSYPLLHPEEVVIDSFIRIPEGKKSTLRSLFMPNVLGFFGIQHDTRPYPHFDTSLCRRCLKCAEVCPAKALELRHGRIYIDKHRCIHCFCCHEMCPFDAIKIK